MAAISIPSKPRRGRPPLGKPVPVVLGEFEIAQARRLGEGVIAEGVRRALRAVSAMGAAEVAALVEKARVDPDSAKGIAQ